MQALVRRRPIIPSGTNSRAASPDDDFTYKLLSSPPSDQEVLAKHSPRKLVFTQISRIDHGALYLQRPYTQTLHTYPSVTLKDR